MNDTIAALEERVRILEERLNKDANPSTEPVSTTLIAPVTIVDQEGNKLAEIAKEWNDTSLKIFNTDGTMAASIGVDGTKSGYLAIRGAKGALTALLDVESYGARLLLNDQNGDFGMALLTNEGSGINFGNKSNNLTLSLWGNEKSGEIKIYDGTTEELILSLP